MKRWPFVAAATLAVAVLSPAPAHAGHYELLPTSGTGSLTVTPLDGEPVVTQWEDLDQLQYQSDPLFRGSISFSYNETWYYYWVPEYANDEPTSRSYALNGATTIDFGTSSSAGFKAGSASASITLFGTTYSASGSSTPNIPNPPTVTKSGDIGTGVARTGTVTLSGWEGEFSLSYSGEASTDTNHAMTVDFGFSRSTPAGGGPPHVHILKPNSDLYYLAPGQQIALWALVVREQSQAF